VNKLDKKFVCKVCKGTGLVDNPAFEHCEKTDQIKCEKGDCENCPVYIKKECQRGEQIACENCYGTGQLLLNMDLWVEA